MAISGINAQTPAFFHLTLANGLSDNNVRSLAIDRKGFLWAGCADGVNVYDGYSVTSYTHDNYPDIPAAAITQMLCDSHDNTWVASAEATSWIDSKRTIHKVVLQDSISRFGCRAIIETKSFGIVLLTSRGHFFQNKTSGIWEQIKETPRQIGFGKIRDEQSFDDDRVMFVTDSFLLLWDYSTKQIVARQPFKGATSVCKIKGNEVALALAAGEVLIMDLFTGVVRRQYKLISELDDKKIIIGITQIRQASNGTLVLASSYNGLITIDSSGTINKYVHSPFDARSIVSSNTYRVFTGETGEVIVGSNTSGLSMYNVYNRQIGFKGFYTDAAGNYTDNFIVNKIAEDNKGILWLSTFDRLIRWDKANDKSQFFYYYMGQSDTDLHSTDIRGICFDRSGKLWAGISGEGLAVFNDKTGKFNKVPVDTSKGPALQSTFIPEMILANNGLIWTCSNRGLYTINPLNSSVDAFINHPVLKEFSGKRLNGLFEDSQKRIWIASNSNGLYCYDPVSNVLKNYTVKDGLASNITYMIREGKDGTIYSTNSEGFSALSKTGKIRSYTKANGLRYSRCESLLTSDDGMVWLSNSKCIVRFNPADSSMQFFDENTGFTNEGYRVGSCFMTSKGEFIWAGYRGISYFYPAQLKKRPAIFSVTVYQATTTDSIYYFRENQRIRLPFSGNSISFQYTATQLGYADKIQYKYMLEGYDNEWQETQNITQARYVSIPPGKYTFKVMASRDEVNWSYADNRISVTVIPPLWRKWWFVSLCLIVITGSIFVLFQNRNKKIREQKEQLETEQAINYFASSMSEQVTEENILWDVAKNCIGRLQFEDCVIYLFDEQKNVLVQKAAHGPKSPKQFTIDKPLEIKSGKGIVGHVADSMKAEIVNDTSRDARYIVDDEQRLSEITVPIIYDGKVLGVIDCEHSKKGFFTQKHLSILTTIASLCANKIVRTRAEEEKKETQAILMNTQQKMTEVEMQALRAQMNPHFIFNCLNSINRYIVKSDQATASLYLTKFAKLIRLILDNSNSKNVMLTNELDALKLYIEMEALRFDKKFSYEVKVEGHFSTDSVEVPPLIIQPYVENAIWHGLLHKENNGHLSIRVSLATEGMLQCIIEDNGVGRKKAKELRSKTATSRKSLGMQLTENRLSLLNKHAELNASVEIIDLQNGNETAIGTKVILKIPV